MEIDKSKYGKNCIGHVIRIISDKEIIINVGDEDLTVGDYIQIYSAGESLIDLDGTELGVYENIKETLEVTYTSTYYSVCKKISTSTNYPLDITNFFSGMTPITTTTVEKLSVDESEIDPLKIDFDKTIHKGDPVKKR